MVALLGPALSPPLNYDTLEYHLGVIPHYFQEGIVAPIPHVFYSAQPLGTEMLYTLAAVLDFELPDNAAEDSHDLLPLLKGDRESVRTTHVHNTRAGQYAIRHEDWLLINARNGYVSGRNKNWEEKHKYPNDDDLPTELYNMADDPGQRVNLASEHPDRVRELQALLKKTREQGYSAPRLAN